MWTQMAAVAVAKARAERTSSILIEHRIKDGRRLSFWCPACKLHHSIDLLVRDELATQLFNDNMEKPTIIPAIRTVAGNSVCHLFIRNGLILYLEDSSHSYAQQIIHMEHH